LNNLEDDSRFGDEEVDKVLMALLFLFFTVVGYALFHFL
jgi:hypothetical protein